MATHLCTKGTSPKLHVWNCGIDKCVHFYNKTCPEHEPKEVSVPNRWVNHEAGVYQRQGNESWQPKVPNMRNESLS